MVRREPSKSDALTCERYETTSAMVKIMSSADAFCMVFPFSDVRSWKTDGSGISSAETIHGPRGQKPSWVTLVRTTTTLI
jgi:hypothetical protein